MKSGVLPTVYIVDDDSDMREAITDLVESVGLRAESFASGEEFLRRRRTADPSCLVLDVRLPQISGLDFQRQLADTDIQIPIIFITAHGDIPMSVRALKSGAVEFLTKPFRDQIGFEIGASEATVKIHRGHVMQKMQAESLADLVRMADKLKVSTNK